MSENKFKDVSTELAFKFDNPEAALHFKAWLCGQGEQGYWLWMEYREQEEPGDITALNFDYWNGDLITAKCGRQDSEE